MTFDETARAAVDRLITGLQTQLDADLRAFTDELARVAATERTRAATQAAEAAAAEVRRQAHAQLSQLREAAKKQTDELRRSAEAQVGEWRRTVDDIRRAHQQEIEAVRGKAASDVEDARRMAEAQVEDVQRTYEQRLAQGRQEQDALRREIDATRLQGEEARRAAAAEAEELVIAQLAAAHADHERKLDAVVEKTRTDGHQSELAYAARLVDAFRAMDEARTLGDILDALAQSAGREVDRAAVLLVKGERLQGWRWSGFNGAAPPARSVQLAFDDAGVAGAAARDGATVARAIVESSRSADRQPVLPPFARDAGPRHALSMPVTVGGVVVAVLYADASRVDAPTSASRWPAILEILTRHASRSLEALTVQQAAGMVLPRPVARPSHSPLPGPVEHATGDGDEDAARRYARLFVSEVRMFNEPQVDAGRKSRDLLARLGGEIDRARRLYEARVPPTCTRRAEFFDQELVRTLADGDRTLLGSL